MSCKLIQFPQPPKGNGALELVKEYLEQIHPARAMARVVVGDDLPEGYLPDADYFLLWLAQAGYVITKLED